MTIGELASKSGATARAIRLYGELELLGPVLRSKSGYRQYGEDHLRRLTVIHRLRALGYRLDDIARVLRDPSERFGPLLEEQAKAIESELRRLHRLKSQIDLWRHRLQHSRALNLTELQALLEVQNMLHDHLTKKAIDDSKGKHEALGDARHQEAQKALSSHLRDSHRCFIEGRTPSSREAQSAVDKIRALMDEFLSLEARDQVLSSEHALQALLTSHEIHEELDFVRWVQRALGERKP